MHLSEKQHTWALFAIVVATCALGSLSQTVTNFVLVIIALTGAVGAEAVIWDYRAAFALSAALSLVVLVTAVWKIR